MKTICLVLFGLTAALSCMAQGGNSDNQSERDAAIAKCMDSCIKTTTADPYAKEWKMTDREITELCSCNCGRTIDPLAAIYSELKGKTKAEIQSDPRVKQITVDAMNYCYPKFFESRRGTKK